MLGIVDVGGGLRGAYSSGIYDCFLEENFKPDYCLGVSAGSANLITFIAKQKERTLRFYRDYSQRKEYMSAQNLIKCGSYLDLDYVFGDLSNRDGEDPLDFDAFKASDIIFRVAATRASDGEQHFFTNDDVILNDYYILKASCCIPIVCKGIKVADETYYDGGIANPIPIYKAFEDGCDKVILVLTKAREDYKLPIEHSKLFHTLATKANKNIIDMLDHMHEKAGEVLEEVEQLEKEGKLYVIEPKDCFGMTTLTKDPEQIQKMYDAGKADAKTLLDTILVK